MNNANKENNSRFASASMICGFISLGMIMTGILSIAVGGLGILFASLSTRNGVAMHRKAKVGLTASIFGFIVGIIVTAISAISVYASIKDGTFLKQFNQMYESVYGESIDLKEYGIDIEGFQSFQDYLNSSEAIVR